MNAPIIAGGIAALYLLTRGKDQPAAPAAPASTPEGSVSIAEVCRGDGTDCIDGAGNPNPVASIKVADVHAAPRALTRPMSAPVAMAAELKAAGGTAAVPPTAAGAGPVEGIAASGAPVVVTHDGHGPVMTPTAAEAPRVSDRPSYTAPDCPECAARKSADRVEAVKATAKETAVPEKTKTGENYWPSVTSRVRANAIMIAGARNGAIW